MSNANLSYLHKASTSMLTAFLISHQYSLLTQYEGCCADRPCEHGHSGSEGCEGMSTELVQRRNGGPSPSAVEAHADAIDKDLRLPVHSAKAQHDALSGRATLALAAPLLGHCEVAPVPHPGGTHIASPHTCSIVIST